jgi:hypothetical protein
VVITHNWQSPLCATVSVQPNAAISNFVIQQSSGEGLSPKSGGYPPSRSAPAWARRSTSETCTGGSVTCPSGTAQSSCSSWRSGRS